MGWSSEDTGSPRTGQLGGWASAFGEVVEQPRPKRINDVLVRMLRVFRLINPLTAPLLAFVVRERLAEILASWVNGQGCGLAT
jgi:hypothetical protein